MTSSDSHTIRLGGELDVASAPSITSQTDAALSQGARELVYDLGDVVFMDSTAIGALISAREAATKAGATVRLVNVSPTTHRLFTLTALDSIFQIEDAPDSPDDADDD